MASYPRPRSRGCNICRAMKVKCDQEMPHCRRCLNAGRICTGYRAEDELVFRDMSETAKDKVQSRVKDRKAKRSLKNNDSLASKSAGTPDLDSEDLNLSNPAALSPFDHHSVEICTAKDLLGPVPSPLSPDWASQAPAIFFADYVYCSPRPRYPGGYLEFLPSLCVEESKSSCLMEALDAVSFANLSSQSSLNWLIRRARWSYGKALVSLHAALQNPQEVIKDSTLATVLLMGLYELISGDKPAKTIWDSHSNGRKLLVQRRGLRQLQTPRGESMFRVMFTQVQMVSMFQRQAQTSEELELLKAADKDLPYVILATYQARLATLRATAPTNHHNLDLLHEPTQRSVEAWWVGAIALNSEMQAWGEHICQGSLAYSELLNETGTWPQTLHVYPDILTAGFWNSYRCARILLLSDLHDYEARIGLTFVFAEPNNFQASMLQMINEICASVPFLLGDFDPQGSLQRGAGRMSLGGFFLVFALHVVSHVRIVKDDQRAWIKGRLKRVGYTMGIKQAHLLCERL